MINVRNDCLNLLIEILESQRPLHLVIAEYLNTHREMDGADRAFVSRLVRGTVERMITLDYVINSVSSTRVNKCKPVIRNILRMGVYQLLYMEVPDSAACNESVKLAQRRNFGNLSGFVNGNLRSVARMKTECCRSLPESTGVNIVVANLVAKDKKLTPVQVLSIIFSVPEWIVKHFIVNYGEERTIEVFKYWLESNRTNICTVSSKIKPEELEERLKARGVTVSATSVPGSFSIEAFGSPDALTEFREGLFFIQDLSSTMAVNQAEFHAGDHVLDLCAAPGGKTMHAADLLLAADREQIPAEAVSSVTSCDISERKVALIRQNIERCGLVNVHTMVNDATVLNGEFVDTFDIVLCDVPCSGLGIVGRKPDIKYNMSPEGQTELVALQRRILDNAVNYVKHQGQLIYSTCTVNKAENQENVDYIKSKGFKCITSRQLLPGEEGTDGFFYAKLVRE